MWLDPHEGTAGPQELHEVPGDQGPVAFMHDCNNESNMDNVVSVMKLRRKGLLTIRNVETHICWQAAHGEKLFRGNVETVEAMCGIASALQIQRSNPRPRGHVGNVCVLSRHDALYKRMQYISQIVNIQLVLLVKSAHNQHVKSLQHGHHLGFYLLLSSASRPSR